MRLSVFTAVFVCAGAVVASVAYAVQIQYQPRGVITDLLIGKPSVSPVSVTGIKPIKPTETSWGPLIGPDEDDDGCERHYPLSPKGPQQIPYAFNRYGISPYLTEPPRGLLNVEYEDMRRCQPHLGNDVDVCDLYEAPHKLKWKCHRDKKYTLYLVDLYPMGVAYPKLLSQGILWWVVDIPGCEVHNGYPIYEYQQPLPLYGTGKNKYAFLVYEQPPYEVDWTEETVVSSTSEKHRFYKCLDKMVYKYNLKLVAGNFFCSEFQPCVEEGLDNLDDNPPQYVSKSQESANLPEDPYEHKRKHRIKKYGTPTKQNGTYQQESEELDTDAPNEQRNAARL